MSILRDHFELVFQVLDGILGILVFNSQGLNGLDQGVHAGSEAF